MKCVKLALLFISMEALLLSQPYYYMALVHKHRRVNLNKGHEQYKMVLHWKDPSDFQFA